MTVEIRESVAYFAWNVYADEEWVGTILPAPSGGYSISSSTAYPTLREAADALVAKHSAAVS